MINKFRRLLIRIGKILPFVLCGFVFCCYFESLFAMLTNNFALYDESIVLNTQFSFAIARKVQYDIFALFIIFIISVAIETCYWNKICIVYLLIQLGEKQLFSQIELYEEYIYAIVLANIIVSGFLVWKGIIILKD